MNYSYNFSRDLVEGEQLDFSYDSFRNNTGNGECDVFLETTNPDSNDHMLVADQCYNLRNGEPYSVSA